MRIKQLLTMTFALSLVLSCGDSPIKEPELPKGDNPFFNEFNTPFNVPPFSSIKTEDYMPAFEAGIKYQNEYIANILEAKPSFATIEALEYSNKVISKVSTVFYPLTSAHTSDELEEINAQVSTLITAHNDDIYMNADLFAKVKAVFDTKDKYKLNGEQYKLLEKTYTAFIRSGINLEAEKQNRLREINKELSGLTVQFGKNVLAYVNEFKLLVGNRADLSGLPESIINAAEEDAKAEGYSNLWSFTLQNPSAVPFLQYADNRELRKRMYQAYTTKCTDGEFNNSLIVEKIAILREERAKLLGYQNHSSYVLEEAMAKTPEAVKDLLTKLWEPAIVVAKDERDQMQELMSKTHKGQKLEAWDWQYYAEKVRQEKYKLDGEAVRPYLTLENVRNGIFALCDKLYGLSFEQTNIPIYQDDVTAFEVKDNGKHLGILYMDFHPRASKKSGAWMTSFRKASIKNGKRIPPVITIVCNFSKPDGDIPALLTADEAETFFHEFGHALHGLLGNTEYTSLSGTSVPRDFVELPSQVMENWVFEPELLALYAKHYETGEVLPAELVEKMDAASKFNQGFKTVEYLAASFLDLAYHTKMEKVVGFDAHQFEKQTMDEIGLIPEIAPRYRSTYFLHIFNGGYASSYYSYIWAEVLDSDAFAAFKESGDIFNKEIATSFRKNVLEKGGTDDPMLMYKAFRGKDPDMKYLLSKRGLDK